jgi:hypothetical protein
MVAGSMRGVLSTLNGPPQSLICHRILPLAEHHIISIAVVASGNMVPTVTVVLSSYAG